MIPIQFSHATGFPAESYSFFFKQLSPHPISFVPVFGVSEYEFKTTWRDLIPELIDHIERTHKEPVIGIGHSFGAVLTFWAAKQRPDLFRKIILMDPPFLSFRRRCFIFCVNILGLGEKAVPMVRNAKKRRSRFESLAEAHTYWRPKFLFRNFHDQCFEDYVRFGLVPDKEAFTLRIPTELESKFFLKTPVWIGATKLEMPSYYIYPGDKGIMKAPDLAEQKKKFRYTEFISYNGGGHMFPLERPFEVAALVKDIISRP